MKKNTKIKSNHTSTFCWTAFIEITGHLNQFTVEFWDKWN
jgi:hypothetical protein